MKQGFVHKVNNKSGGNTKKSSNQNVARLSSSHNPIQQLHTSLSNQAVQKLVEQGLIQTKLKIGNPNDKYEQEADRVAEEVMRTPSSPIDNSAAHYNSQSADITPIKSLPIQRTCAACQKGQATITEVEEEERVQTLYKHSHILQRMPDDEDDDNEGIIQGKMLNIPAAQQYKPHKGNEAIQLSAPELDVANKRNTQNIQTSGLTGNTQSLMQGGAPLPISSRTYFESRMGRDLSNVRIHTGDMASRYSASLNAHAFTIGDHVWLGQGLRPEPSFVMAHELAHVLQQRQPPALQQKNQNNPIKSEADTKKIIRRAEFYWVPVGISKPMTGSDIHKRITRAMVPSGGAIKREVKIPNADRNSNVGFDITGQADFYKSSPASRIGVTFKSDPGSTQTCNTNPLGKPSTLYASGSPKQLGGKVIEVDKGPDNVTLGELKPASSSAVSFGKSQMASYEKGIKFAREQANCSSDKVNGSTDRWPDITFNRFDDSSLPVPNDYVYQPASPLTNYRLAVGTFTGPGEGVDVVFNPGTMLRQNVNGGLYAMHKGDGLVAYFARPADLDATAAIPNASALQQAYADEATQLQSEVITPLTTGPEVKKLSRNHKKVRSVFKPVSRDSKNILRRLAPKKTAKLVDPFPKVYSRWKSQHTKFSKTFKKGKKGADQKKLRFLELMYKAEASADKAGVPKPTKKLPPKSKYAIDIKPKKGTKGKTKSRELPGLYSTMKAWANPGIKFLGKLRKTFGGTFIWVSNKVRDLRSRLQSRLNRQEKGSRGGGKSYAAIAVRAFWKASVKIGGVVLRNTINLLVQSLGQGLKNKMKDIIPLDPESLEQAAENNFPQLTQLKAEIEAIKKDVKAKIDDTVKWFDEKFKDLIDYAKAAKKYGKYIKWGMVLLQCATPPGWGCLKLLAKRLIAEVIEQILNLCGVKKKFQGLVLATGWFNDIPKSLATRVADKVEGLVPSKINPIFDRSIINTAGPPTASQLGCSDEPSGIELAFQDMQEALEEKYGVDGYKAFTDAIKKYGIPSDRELTPEDIQNIRDQFLGGDITPEMLREYINANPKPGLKNAKVVNLLKFIEHVKTTTRKSRIKGVAKDLKSGKLKKDFSSLGPGGFLIMPVTSVEFSTGKAASKQIIYRGRTGEPEKQSGVADITIDIESLDCDTGKFKLTFDKVELFDSKENPQKSDLKGKTIEANIITGKLKDKVCKP